MRICNVDPIVGGAVTTTRLAAAGLGNFYVLGASQDVVVKYATLDVPGVACGLAIDDDDILDVAAPIEVLCCQLQP